MQIEQIDYSANLCETVNGMYVNIVKPEQETILIDDIAWALSRQARFAGHTNSDEVWNVAQHSIFVQELVSFALDPLDPMNLENSMLAWVNAHSDTSTFMQNTELGVSCTKVMMGALLHDASEAYLVDLPTPIKRYAAVGGPYKELEHRMMNIIREAFWLDELTDVEQHIIRWADLMALKIEANKLMYSRGNDWNGVYPDLNDEDFKLFPTEIMHWRKSYIAFLQTFNNLYVKLRA
jgi:5'-deoxynucleotidase YfbR-like HD superfamily hydrolase